MLLDTNIIIYAARPDGGALRAFIRANNPFVSAVSYVEALGYHRLTEPERAALEELFRAATVLPIDSRVIDRATNLRQRRRMSLGDSLIAATALVHDLPLVTHNGDDFRWLTELTIVDPVAP